MYLLNNLTIIIVCYVCTTKFQRLVLLWSLFDIQTFEVIQDQYSSLILNHAFDFWLAEKYFEPSWRSSLVKTGPAGPAPCNMELRIQWDSEVESPDARDNYETKYQSCQGSGHSDAIYMSRARDPNNRMFLHVLNVNIYTAKNVFNSAMLL